MTLIREGLAAPLSGSPGWDARSDAKGVCTAFAAGLAPEYSGPMSVVMLPYALAEDGRLVSCKTALREVRYRCPGCRERLVLKRGDRNQPHFAHAGDSQCSGEGVAHLLAKLLVQQTLLDSRTQASLTPRFTVPCAVCEMPLASDMPAFDT